MPLILSLDVNDKAKAATILQQTRPSISHVKIGHIPLMMGFEVIQTMTQFTPLFLDIKLHDIPNTMAQSIKGYRQTFKNLDMITIWGDTQTEALDAAVAGSENECKILSVIQLSSRPCDTDAFLKTVDMNLKHGINWFITPTSMLSAMRQHFGKDVHLVTPGIRLHDKNDHHVTMTPKQALEHGCDYIIVGRPIIEASNPGLEIQNYCINI